MATPSPQTANTPAMWTARATVVKVDPAGSPLDDAVGEWEAATPGLGGASRQQPVCPP